MIATKTNFEPLCFHQRIPHGQVLTPGRYVGAEDVEDDDDMRFEERMQQLTTKLKEQFAESRRLEDRILSALSNLCSSQTQGGS